MPDATPSLEGFLRRAAEICDGYDELRAHARRLDTIAGAANQPFTLAVVGRMKTGKSTLLNSLIGFPLALSDVEEATATINWIRYGTGDQTGRMIVHWRDGRNEIVPRDRIAEWSGKKPEVLQRAQQTDWLEFFADLPVLKHIQFVDTPGTGSAVGAHEEMAREFLSPRTIESSVAEGRKADAIVYVVTPVGRESDLEILDDFKQGRLPASGAYNSVCVLHKWDGLECGPDTSPYAEACEKARRLRAQLGDTVADVICVSGPLALAARAAPDGFFRGVIDLVQAVASGDLDRPLSSPDRWDRDPARQKVRQGYPMPWVCFSRLVGLCRGSGSELTADTLRRECLRQSRIEDLERFLEERFFARAGIIKQNQTLRKAQEEIEPAILKLRQVLHATESSARNAAELLRLAPGITQTQQEWLTETVVKASREVSRTRACLTELDSLWTTHRERQRGLVMDLRVCEFVSSQPTRFTETERNRICSLCDILAGQKRRAELGGSRLPSLPDLHSLIDRYRAMQNTAPRREAEVFEHLVDRLTEAVQWQKDNAQ
jgi:hypothetical protein